MRLKLRRDLIRPPRLRGPHEAVERHATWLELFVDLAFVAVVAQLATVLASDYTWPGAAKAGLLFVVVWWVWVGNTFYLARFDTDDLMHRLQGFVLIALIPAAAVTVGSAFEGDSDLFALSIAGMRALLVTQYALAARMSCEAAPLGRTYALAFLPSVVIWPLTLFVPAPWKYVLWTALIIHDLLVPLRRSVRKLHIQHPPNPHHVPERFGLFTIIMLGESIVAAVAGLQARPGGDFPWALGLMALLAAFGIWWLYFEGVQGSQARHARSAGDVRRIQGWIYSHLALHFGILLMAVAVKKGLQEGPFHAFKPEKAALLWVGIMLVQLALHALYHTAVEDRHRRTAWKRGLPYWVLTLLGGAAVGLAGAVSAPAWVTLGAAVGMLGGQMAINLVVPTYFGDPDPDVPGSPQPGEEGGGHSFTAGPP
ncbi:MAG: low temperature requirement protein A [Fimbriimonadaceae bacterium]|nr:low temperature requirement protein A [Fimbriimonadaceae bacterium]